MKVVNARGKLFGIINAIDLLFVLVIIGAGVLVYMYFDTGGFKEGESVTVRYTVEFQGMKKGAHGLLAVGDTVKDSVNGYYLGTVSDIEIKTSEAWQYSHDDDAFIKEVYDDEEVVLLTIESDGLETDLKIVSEDNEVRIGKEMFIEAKGFARNGYIIALSTESKEKK